MRLAGELDLATVDTLRACVESVDNGFGTIVLELSDLTFLDSTGIGFFASLDRELGPQFRQLELRGVQGHVRRVLELSGVSQVVPTVWADLSQAGSQPGEIS